MPQEPLLGSRGGGRSRHQSLGQLFHSRGRFNEFVAVERSSHLAAGKLALLRHTVARLIKGNGLPRRNKGWHTSLARHKQQCEGTQGAHGMCFRGFFSPSPQGATQPSSPPLRSPSLGGRSQGPGASQWLWQMLTVDRLLAEMGLRALVVGALLGDYRLVGSKVFEVT